MLQSIDVPACTSCGACCYQTVELADAGDDVPEEMVVEHDGVRCMGQEGNGACVALDQVTRLCTIYERRPQICRRFERGGALCLKVLARGVGLPLKPPSKDSAKSASYTEPNRS